MQGTVTIEALRDWLADRVQAVADSDDPAVQQLAASAWILLAAYDYDYRDETEVRRAIAEGLREKTWA